MINKVLLATMSLGIGGAETHIIELALELKRRGIEVHVASNGGVYVADLDAVGIPHHSVPMDKRSISCMIKSLLLMRKIIKRIKPDIVHAHARIPGFICGLLRKVMRFGFVTTAHFDFDIGHGLRYLTNWGQKAIAVSEDIKRYLVESYGLAPRDIFVTINGIDTNKFAPSVSPAGVIEEFGLDPSRPIICNVSRLDENAALVSRLLIESATELHRKLPGVQLLIAGNGDIFDELKAAAESVNAATGSNTVTLTGPRTDINAILTAGTLFVGVSRAALEALAAARPAIIAGNEGYLGLFTSDKENVAYETNFTCRGCEKPTRELLIDEILYYFNGLTEAEHKGLGEFGRSLIIRDYSVSRMTEDCLSAYDSVAEHKYNVLLSGYYGFKNAGDDAILQSIYSSVKSSVDDISVTVLSYDPEDTKARYGCGAVDRFKVFSVLRALRRCDVLVSGGGSLLQDYTSTRSLMYYLFIIRAAKLFGKKVVLYANGIGPVRKNVNRRRVKRVVSRADIISLRDAASLAELRAMGVERRDMRVTADPVFTLRGEPRDESVRLLEKCGVPNAPFAVISIRDWPEMTGFCEGAALVCDAIYDDYKRNVVFISMQSNKDIAISLRVSRLMKNPAFVLEARFTADELMGIIGAADAVLAMRLHALIFAARMRTPFAGIVYDPKVSSYTEMLSMPSAGSVADFNLDSALEAVRSLFEHHKEYVSILETKSAELEAAANADAADLLKLLKSIVKG